MRRSGFFALLCWCTLTVVLLPARLAKADVGVQEIEAIERELAALELAEAEWTEAREAVEEIFLDAHEAADGKGRLDAKAKAHLRRLMGKAKAHIGKLKGKIKGFQGKLKGYGSAARVKAKARLGRIRGWIKVMAAKVKAIELAQQAAQARAAAAEADVESARAYWADAKAQAKAYLGKLKSFYSKGKHYSNKARAKMKALMGKYQSKAKGWVNKARAKAKGYLGRMKAYGRGMFSKAKGYRSKAKAWAQGQVNKAKAMALARSDDEVRRLVVEAAKATRRADD